VPHSVSTTDSPSFFQLVLFLAAAAASPQDLSPADAIFLRVVLLHVSLGREYRYCDKIAYRIPTFSYWE